MRRISISELTTPRWSFFQDVERYTEFGFNSIGLWRQKLDGVNHDEAIENLYKLNVDVACVHWAGGFTGSNGISHVDAIDDAMEAIELAAQLNSPYVIVHPGSKSGHTQSHANRLLSTAFDQLIPFSSDHGVKILLEPNPGAIGRNWTIFPTLESTLEFAKNWTTDELGLVLDLYHFGLSDRAFEKLPSFVDRLSHVQIADRTGRLSSRELRRPPGTGNVPISKWLERLQELGYCGEFELEVHGEGCWHQSYEEILFDTRQYLNDMRIQNALVMPPPKTRKTNQVQPVRVDQSQNG